MTRAKLGSTTCIGHIWHRFVSTSDVLQDMPTATWGKLIRTYNVSKRYYYFGRHAFQIWQSPLAHTRVLVPNHTRFIHDILRSRWDSITWTFQLKTAESVFLSGQTCGIQIRDVVDILLSNRHFRPTPNLHQEIRLNLQLLCKFFIYLLLFKFTESQVRRLDPIKCVPNALSMNLLWLLLPR